MAFTFPLFPVNFFNLAKLVESTFWLPPVSEGEETGAGEIYQVQSSPRLWEGSTKIISDTHEANDAMAARANLLLSPGATFLVHPRQRAGPVGDPTASLLGASSPVLNAVNANMRDITISGLPSSYPGLQTGSYLAFSYGALRAFHQVVNGGNASAGAVTVEVIPAIRPGYALDAAVTLVRPPLTAVMKGGSFRPVQHRAGVSLGFSFEWRQTLRA